MEASDVALMGDDLLKVPYLFSLGKPAVRTINANILFAVAFNIPAMPAPGAGRLGPVTGALAQQHRIDSGRRQFRRANWGAPLTVLQIPFFIGLKLA